MNVNDRAPGDPIRSSERRETQARALARRLRAGLRPGWGVVLLATGALSAGCSGEAAAPGDLPRSDEGVIARHGEALSAARLPSGKRLFDEPFANTNGRSCATCHVREDDTTLKPAHVEALLASDPSDPLFNRLDADDPDAEELTFEHLAKGLVRVVLPLADNVDVIDASGQVITNPERTIEVWRAVPTVANTAITAPYQYDGRAPTLEEQAQGAITSHSEGGVVPARALQRIAEFEKDQFSSWRARFVFERLEHGASLDDIASPEDWMHLSRRERRGREVYDAACEPCHGGATTRQIVNDDVHALGFFELTPEGFVVFDVPEGAPPVPVLAPHENDGFLPGYGILSYLGQVGAFPAFNASVSLPRYRLRFYTDATRSEAVTELPARFLTRSGAPNDPNPATDERGVPLVGPSFVPQAFTTDPGRAAITGDPLDFEAFDMPQLRGIAGTAPYFHDNAAETLADVVDIYSRFVLPLLPPLNLPRTQPPEAPVESLSAEEKADLLAFLQRL